MVNTPVKPVVPTESTPLNNDDIFSVVGISPDKERQSKIDNIILDEDLKKKSSRFNFRSKYGSTVEFVPVALDKLSPSKLMKAKPKFERLGAENVRAEGSTGRDVID